MSNRVQLNVARIGGFDADEFFCVVTEPVLVTFNSGAPLPWRCEVHGRHIRPTCDHEKAAANRVRKEWNDRTRPDTG